MIAQSQSLLDVIQRVDADFLGVVMVIGTVGFFITLIISVVSIVRTINHLSVTRMNHSMVKSLLSQGYGVDEVERLTYGGQKWSRKVRNFVHSAKSSFDELRGANGQPSPPMKQAI